MTVFGWCIPCRQDRPSVPGQRRCADCGHILIPPSWGDRRWQWTDGTWAPYKPRPEGWRWEQPVERESTTGTIRRPPPAPKPPVAKALAMKKAQKKAPFTPSASAATSAAARRLRSVRRATPPPGRRFICAHCKKEAAETRPSGTVQRYCSRACSKAAWNRVRIDQRRAEMIRCERCGAEAPAYPETGGRRRRFCSTACQVGANDTRRWAMPMAARGLTCADCGQGDRPYRGHGLCDRCWKRAHRARARLEVAS